MLEQVKPKTKAEEMDELTKEVGQAFFDYGRTKYEIDLKHRQLEETSVKIHNLNQKALKLQESIEKEANKESMKIELAKAPVPQ